MTEKNNINTIGDFVNKETRKYELQEKVFLLIEEVNKLRAENQRLKKTIDELMDGRC